MNDAHYMTMALDLALKGRGCTSPNPIVGAVIVKGKKIIAKGWHQRCGGDHAEAAALKKAGPRAKGATLYVTLEPCYHYGRTPPCVDTIIQKGLRRVVIGMKDPNPKTRGKSIAKLKKARITTKMVAIENLEAANEIFIKYIKSKMPFVAAKWAQTIDGKIATANYQSQWITSKRSREYARRLRNDFDAILVGKGTVLKDNPSLNAADKTKRLKKIILDTTLAIPTTAKLFKQTKPGDVIIATGRKVNPAKYRTLQKQGVTVIPCLLKGKHIDLRWLFKELARRDITSIFIEGGGRVIGNALKERLVDKLFVFVAPKIMGDKQAVNAVDGIKTRHVNHTIRMKDATLEEIGEDILITSYVHGNR